MLILMEYPRKILHISPPPHKFCPSDNVNHKDKKQSWKYVSQKKDDGTLYEPFMNLRHLIDFRHRRQKVLISWNFEGLKVERFASVWMRWSYLMKQTASLFGVSSSIDKILCGTINSSQMYPTSACSSDFIFPLTLFFWLNVNVSKLEYRHFCKCSHVGSTLNWRVWKTFQQQKCDPRNKGYVFFRQ